MGTAVYFMCGVYFLYYMSVFYRFCDSYEPHDGIMLVKYCGHTHCLITFFVPTLLNSYNNRIVLLYCYQSHYAWDWSLLI